MSVSVAKNRFINFSLAAKYHFLEGVSNIVKLGKHLTSAAETAQLMWQADAVREYGLMLSNLPVKEYQLIGQYYLAWHAYCSGNDVTASQFENIFAESKTYKAKSLITLGAFAGARQDLESEMRYYKEALEQSDLATSVRVHRAIAIVKSKEGFHKSAVRSLESALPILRFAQPQVYYDTLNSLAVELGEVGRIEEANNICRVVVASPYAFAYPKWRETEQELALRAYKSRSAVSVSQKIKPHAAKQVSLDSDNILHLPQRSLTSASPASKRKASLAPILDYQKWKAKMEEQKELANIRNMSEKDIFMEILRISSHPSISRQALLNILEEARRSAPCPDES